MQVVDMLHSALISFTVLNYLISTCSISEASPINTVSEYLIWTFSTLLLLLIVHKYIHVTYFPNFL